MDSLSLRYLETIQTIWSSYRTKFSSKSWVRRKLSIFLEISQITSSSDDFSGHLTCLFRIWSMIQFLIVARKLSVVRNFWILRTLCKKSSLMSKVNTCLNLYLIYWCSPKNSVFQIWSALLMPSKWSSPPVHQRSGNSWRPQSSQMNKLLMSSHCAGIEKTQLSLLDLLLHSSHQRTSARR